MTKFYKLLLFLLLALNCVSLVAHAQPVYGTSQPYCFFPSGNPCFGPSTNDIINLFTMQPTGGSPSCGITNNSTGCNGNTANLLLNISDTIRVIQGGQIAFSVQCAPQFPQGYQQGFGIWVDWNHDNDLNDVGEFVWNSGVAGFQLFTGTINIPANAILGTTRLRVRSNYASPPTVPCSNNTYGETEDYSIRIYAPSTVFNDPPIGVNDTICAGQSGSVTATGNGILQWFTVPTGGTIIQTGSTLNTPILNNTTSYYVQSKVGNCISPRTLVKVVVSPAFTLNITATADTVCVGGTTDLQASGTNLTYAWTPAASLNITTTNAVTATLSVQTTFTVVATNATGCSATVNKTIYIHPTPVLNTVVNPTTICAGDTAIVTVTGATNCTWTGTYLFANAANDTIWVAPTTTETYSVSATASNGCVGTQTATVNVNALPTAVAGPDETICVGGSVTLNASGGIAYSWSPATGLSASNVNNPTVTINNTQTYTLEVTDANGCKNTDDITVNTVALPVANPGSSVSICPGASTTLNGSGGTSYTWSPATGLSNPNIANPICTPAATGNYTLTVSNAACTSLPSAAITVTVYNQPAAPLINVSGPITFCQGNSVTLTSTAVANNVWSTGATSNSITVTTSGSYTVYFVDANGCSSAVSAAVNVLVNPLPAVPTISASGPLTVCPGGSVDLTSTVANAYNWSNGINTQTITVIASGSYNVTISDINGCTATSNNTVFTVLAPPTAPIITASGPLSFCTGDSVTLSSSPSSTYLWSNGATSQNITVYGTGTYSVTNTNAAGCITPTSAITNTTMFPVPPAPIITAGGPVTFCNGGNVVLTSSAASSYTWSNTYNTQSITVITSGTYNLSITDANGCPSPLSSDVIVTVNPLPASPTITASGPTTFCVGSSVTLQSSEAVGNLWSTGSAANSINVTNSGNYSVTFTDANNCTSVASNPVMVTAMALAPTPVITTNGPTTFCENDSLILTCSQAQTYTWNTGETTPSITVYTAGTYTATVTDVCNPTNPNVDIIITVNPSPVALFTAPTLVDCLPSNIEFINNSVGVAASLWNFGDGGNSNETNPVYAYQFPGLYTISLTVFDTNGCSNTKTINELIQIYPAAELNYTIFPRVTNLLNSNIVFQNNTPNCASQEWDLGIYGSSTSQVYNYTFEDLGTYYVGLSVITENGCMEEIVDSVIIEENYAVFIPTSFTPNGDGLNDVFMPLGGGIEKFKLEIYNRWGNMIYSTNSMSQPWDGNDHGQDNYIWKVYLKDKDGVDREMIGSVTLLR
jgi:gliding motility-associated-like protein